MANSFSTKSARRSGVSADLDHWMRLGKPDDKTTVIYRLPKFANPDAIASALIKVGVEPDTVGQQVIIGTVAHKDLQMSLDVKGVLGAEMPSKLSSKAQVLDGDGFEFDKSKDSVANLGRNPRLP